MRAANYALLPCSPDGRQDVRWAARVSATVNQTTCLGFSPVVALEFARNHSNTSRYDTQTLGIGLSVR